MKITKPIQAIEETVGEASTRIVPRINESKYVMFSTAIIHIIDDRARKHVKQMSNIIKPRFATEHHKSIISEAFQISQFTLSSNHFRHWEFADANGHDTRQNPRRINLQVY